MIFVQSRILREAQKVRWENITDSLPKEGLAGVVPAVDICEGGISGGSGRRNSGGSSSRGRRTPDSGAVPPSGSGRSGGFSDRNGRTGSLAFSFLFCPPLRPFQAAVLFLGGCPGKPYKGPTRQGTGASLCLFTLGLPFPFFPLL